MSHFKKRVPIAEFQLPYGKYAGWKLGNLYYQDKEYLGWVSKNFEQGNSVGSRVRDFLKEMGELEKLIPQEQLDLTF
jgi:uncharacterized protein (DUF3820 family)